MKNLQKLFTVLLIIVAVFSCKKDDNNSSANDGVYNTVSAKWVVSTVNSTYESFEFNKSGNYIIVQNVAAVANSIVSKTKAAQSLDVIFGTYKVINDSTIELSDFGIIIFKSGSNNSINFTIIYEGSSTEVNISATKAEEMEVTDKTAMLCKTWHLIKMNDVSVVGTANELTVLFSSAGTYFVKLMNPTTEYTGGLAQWTWKDGTETTLCYSWDGTPTCSGENEVEIVSISSSQLKIIEGSLTYILEPASSTKSAQQLSKTSVNPIAKGFFVK
jgi:hypothetical protein